MNLKRLIPQMAAVALLGLATARAETVTVTNDVSADATWRATNTYLLRTMVYVRTNVTLTIEPGTVIKAGTSNLIGRGTSIPNLVAGLWVTRGAKLQAVGTMDRPIIFTFEGDDVNNPTDVPFNTSGQWGGIVLCGHGRLNSAASLAGGAANPIYERFEGTIEDDAGGPPGTVVGAHLFGGADDADNSGTLRYVSIRYPGTVFAPNRELNGLTMGGVGSGTDISYVEVRNSSDDAFEWWGGNVNTHHLVAAFCEDDDFDTDQGYRGTNQFWFGIKPPWNGSTDSRAFETDGDLNQTISGEPPKSQWAVHNATLIGRGKSITAFGGGVAWNARDEAAPNVLNSVFAEFAVGVLIDNDGNAEFTSGLADLRNSIFDTTIGPSAANANANVLFTDTARANTVEAALLGGISYTNNAALDPRPQSSSPALENVAPQGGGLAQTTYRGAFAPGDNWADKWTSIAQDGTLPAKGAVIHVSSDISTDTTWRAGNTYILQTMVYVKTNVTLTIEPGTVIKAGTSNLIGRGTSIPNLVAGLWVTRGAKLQAVGTVDRPIIFTFDGDDVNNPNDVPFNTSGQWGGIVLCGHGRLNSAASLAGGAANPIYERFEGTIEDDAGGPPGTVVGAHLFGGADDADNSGTLRYVSIRYPGTVFAPNRELNGLTMGGVGSGTDISYVEVLNSSDDAFEWWGGNVNTHHLVAAFCEDDDFDTDQGYRGTNQFWFGIKPPWNGSTDSRAFETDGDLNQTISGEPPKSQWAVHNATLIGRGKSITAFGGGVAWNARDEAAPNVLNSVFAEFAVGVLIDNDGNAEFTSGLADLRNSIFDTTIGPSAANANANVLFTDTARVNTVEAAVLGGISYTNDHGLNPRPQAGSPALSNVLPQGGGLTPTSYRGAFAANDHWADGWTALSRVGILSDGRSLVVVSNDIAANTTWTAGNTYLLRTMVYVKTNVTLTIEPGTVIKAGTSNLIGRGTSIPNLVAGLWVTRGAKLQAVGTVDRPIIFTFDGDDVNNPNDVPFNTSGQWGGIVLCGHGRLNSAASLAGGAANPIYERFEGTIEDDAGGPPGTVVGAHLFGGADDADNSGTLRYVSIRYPGTVFAPNRELNGLTMGGVGSGTDISYVEVLNSSDDAFEWWGGNVNTHHLVAAFCEDDDFDTDQGYRGTNQFWFGIKPPWNGSTDSRAFETDGDLNQTISGEPPKSQWAVHNATLIGRGKSITAFGGGVAWNARDEAAPNVLNSVFAEFAVGVLIDNDGNAEFTSGLADLRNSIFDTTIGPSAANANANVLFTDTARANTVEAAFLTSISYTNDACLNPRPVPFSPALENVAPQGTGLKPTSYRGAFAPGDQWAHKWTALYTQGYLQGVYVPPTDVPPTPPQLAASVSGGMISISWNGEAGVDYAVLSSTDITAPLASWTTEATFSGVGPHTFTAGAGSGNKYFLVVAQ